MTTLPDNLLEEITRRLVRELHPEEIVLFGSHAWGTPDDQSDVDLLVVLADGGAALAEAELRARRCLRGIGVPKDILIRSRADVERLQQVPASLECQIRERGRVIYGRRQARPGPELVDQGRS